VETKLPPGMHLVGDPAYPLMEHLMVPFKDSGRLSRREVRYNMKLSAARCTIERCLCSSQKSIYLGLDISRVELIPEVIVACCILHNLCLALGDEDDTETMFDDCTAQETVQESNSDNSSCDRKAAVSKRDGLANLLFVNHKLLNLRHLMTKLLAV
jgi:hypothetical protein